MTGKSEENRNVKEPVTAFENWASTEVKFKKSRFTWTITNFSFYTKESGEKMISPLFSDEKNNGMKWRLELYPTGCSNDYSSFISLYILLDTCDVEEIPIKCKVGLLDARSECINTSQFNKRTYEEGESYGFKQFITRDFLFDPENGALPDDKLTIYCEISVATEIINKSGKITIPEPKCELQNDFAALLENSTFSDVVLCTEGTEFKAHKLILSARSSVFEAMFSHEMHENKSNRVEITDIKPEVLKVMLSYIYSGEVPRLREIAIELLCAADKYDLDTLKVICEKELCLSLSIENAAEIFEIAFTYNAEQLKIQAQDFLIAHASEIVKTDGWKSMVESHTQLAAEAILTLVN